MGSVLLLGFVIGMRHALEADHVAAVASLSVRAGSRRHVVRLGALWGVGHTLALLAFGAFVLVVAGAVPAALFSWLEMLVGVMLVGLGGDLLLRLWRERVHFHRHRHGDGTVHFHAHSHRGERAGGHDPARHDHDHRRVPPARALLVGLMHGMAGSGALAVLGVGDVATAWLAMAWIAVFGVGSIVGMAALSAIISVPLSAARRLTWLNNGLQAATGAGTVGLGVWVVASQIG